MLHVALNGQFDLYVCKLLNKIYYSVLMLFAFFNNTIYVSQRISSFVLFKYREHCIKTDTKVLREEKSLHLCI